MFNTNNQNYTNYQQNESNQLKKVNQKAMLRALLRKSQRDQRRASTSSNHASVDNAKTKFLQDIETEEKRRHISVAQIQGLHRGWKARLELRRRRRILQCCVDIQRMYRGLLGRRIALEKRLQKLRVVPTKWAMLELKRKCVVLRDMGPWQELREPETGHVFYLYKPTLDSQWAAPKMFSERFSCTWRDCQIQCDSLIELEAHRRDTHWWHCDACFHKNKVDNFPICSECENTFSGTGKTLQRAYEQNWETTLIMKEKVKNPLDPTGKPNIIERNTLTDLRPMSAADLTFLDIRKEVLQDLKDRPQTVAEKIIKKNNTMWPRASTTKIKLTGQQRRAMRESQRISGGTIDPDIVYQIQNPEDYDPVRRGMTLQEYITEQREIAEEEEQDRKDQEREEKEEEECLARGEEYKPKTKKKKKKKRSAAAMRAATEKDNKEAEQARLNTPGAPGAMRPSTAGNLSLENFARLRGHLRSAKQKVRLKKIRLKEREERKLNSAGSNGTNRNSTSSPNGSLKTSPNNSPPPSRSSTRGSSRGNNPSRDSNTTSNNSDEENENEEGAMGTQLVLEEEETALIKDLPKDLFTTLAKEYYGDQVKSGHGTRNFDSGAIYSGNLKEGVANGIGEMKYHNGDTYNGDWVFSKREGQGSFIAKNGKKYVGQWKNNVRHGWGQLTHPNGEMYVGEWDGGRMHGHGVLSSANGDRYEGGWKDGKYHGIGRFSKAAGHTFIGMCKEGKAEGKGIIEYPTGERYRGDWSNDRRHGRGICTYPDGGTYTGSWLRGKYDGFGTLLQGSGEKYVGGWFSGMRDGYGKSTFSNGDVYVGGWERYV